MHYAQKSDAFENFRVLTTEMKNILLCHSGIIAEVPGAHSGKQLLHSALHPDVHRKRVDAVHPEQQSAVGDLDAHADDLHQLGARLFVVGGLAKGKVDLSRADLLCGVVRLWRKLVVRESP